MYNLPEENAIHDEAQRASEEKEHELIPVGITFMIPRGEYDPEQLRKSVTIHETIVDLQIEML